MNVSTFLGGHRVFHEKLSDSINKRLGDEWEGLLPPSYKMHRIFIHCGVSVRRVANSQWYDKLSVNWCLGDKDVEVLDSSKGFITDG